MAISQIQEIITEYRDHLNELKVNISSEQKNISLNLEVGKLKQRLDEFEIPVIQDNSSDFENLKY